MIPSYRDTNRSDLKRDSLICYIVFASTFISAPFWRPSWISLKFGFWPVFRSRHRRKVCIFSSEADVVFPKSSLVHLWSFGGHICSHISMVYITNELNIKWKPYPVSLFFHADAGTLKWRWPPPPPPASKKISSNINLNNAPVKIRVWENHSYFRSTHSSACDVYL